MPKASRSGIELSEALLRNVTARNIASNFVKARKEYSVGVMSGVIIQYI